MSRGRNKDKAALWGFIEILIFIIIGLAILCGGVVGCSATGKLNSALQEVVDKATEGQRKLSEALVIEGEDGVGKSARPLVEGAKDDFEGIRDQAKTGQKQIPKVEDSTPWWASLLKSGFMALGLGLLLGLLMYLGAGTIIRPIFQRFGLLISPRVREEASMDAQTVVLDSDKLTPQQIRRIEARKITDPGYRKVFEEKTHTLSTVRNGTAGSTSDDSPKSSSNLDIISMSGGSSTSTGPNSEGN